MKNILQKIFNCLVKSYEISHGLRDVNGNLITDCDMIPYMRNRARL
jgi:hypothetical protein